MFKWFALALAVSFGAVTAALAETPEERQACQDDAFRVCERFIPDQDRVFACLVQNHQIISPLCRNALAPYLPQEPPPAAPKQTAKSKAKPAPKSKAATTSKEPLNLNPNVR